MTGYSHLSFWERHEIARFRADGWSLARIAAAIGRGKWTVSRELKRNANKDGSYRPSSAEQRYIARRRRQALLDRMPELARFVVAAAGAAHKSAAIAAEATNPPTNVPSVRSGLTAIMDSAFI